LLLYLDKLIIKLSFVYSNIMFRIRKYTIKIFNKNNFKTKKKFYLLNIIVVNLLELLLS